MIRYGLVIDGKVVKVKKVPETDSLLISKLTAHGYLPIEREVPTYDKLTQVLGDRVFEVEKTRILESFSVSNKSLAEAKMLALLRARMLAKVAMGDIRPLHELVLISFSGTAVQKGSIKTKTDTIYSKLTTQIKNINNATTVKQVREAVSE